MLRVGLVRDRPQLLTLAFPGANRTLGFSQERFDAVEPADQHQRRSVPDQKQRSAEHRLFGQLTEPAQQSHHLAAVPGLADAALHQPRHPLVIAGRERVINRLGDQRVLLVPLGGAEVQLARALGALAHEAAAQEVGEEVMVAVPDPVIV
jgi:hypothetical protein